MENKTGVGKDKELLIGLGYRNEISRQPEQVLWQVVRGTRQKGIVQGMKHNGTPELRPPTRIGRVEQKNIEVVFPL